MALLRMKNSAGFIIQQQEMDIFQSRWHPARNPDNFHFSVSTEKLQKAYEDFLKKSIVFNSVYGTFIKIQ
jgi:hypothetical protein